jgi:hypothetical protein
MSLQQMVLHFKKTDLSGEEIQNLTGKPPILYSDLGKFTNINQVLGKEGFQVVLLQTSSKTTGHWVALTRNDITGRIRYNDSYGFNLPEERQYTKYDEALPMYITNLLANIDYEHNTVDYQAKKSGISTCGRFASLFCKFRNLSLAQIKEMYTMNQDAFFKDVDNTVTLLTLTALDDITSYLSTLPRGGNF